MPNIINIPFTVMFPCCEELQFMCGGLTNAVVQRATINKEKNDMVVSARFERRPAPSEKSLLEIRIATEYGLSSVVIAADFPDAETELVAETNADTQTKGKTTKRKASLTVGKALYGSPVRGKPVPMNTITAESGNLTVVGEVIAVTNRETKNKAKILCFDITDMSGSVRISKFLRPNDDTKITDKIKEGMYVAVSGTASYNRYDDDVVIEPKGIAESVKTLREDDADEKRVELHLHTKFSALDATTDPASVIDTAIRFGHKAIAVTDHGVVQAFPDFWKASRGKDIKVIYGMEGYFHNDIDDTLAVSGMDGRAFDEEFVAFDIETTGLDSIKDRITEIGAVIFSGGTVVASFETFVNPGIPIPKEITKLTGITDRDVYDAPSIDEAILSFLEFAGDRPLAAHNAAFDVGFIDEACRREDIRFEPRYIDTLSLSRMLRPDQRSHNLKSVAMSLGLPDFRHHRATDDAVTVARILERFIPMLKENGAENFGDIARIDTSQSHKTRHITMLAQNKTGLKNLYKLVSISHLENFSKNPLVTKSLLEEYREGLIIGTACEAGELFDSVVRKRSRSELLRLASFYDYLEIQPLCNNAFMIRDGKAEDEEELREFNRRVLEIGRELGKPVIAAGDVHFLEPEHEIFRRIILAGKGFSDADEASPLYFRTTDEMLEEFSYFDEETARELVVENPNKIADMCEDIELFPKKLFTPKIENSAEDLRNLVYARCRELYGDNPPALITERAEAELSDIIRCGYDVIYMSAQKLVQNSLDVGFMVGSRGSVGSSFVAYLSGITEVNSLAAHYRCPSCFHTDFESGREFGCGADMPNKTCPECGEQLAKEGFDIPFETFLGIGGDKIPDIDLNFSGEYQAQAHKFTEELFGKENVYRSGTIGTIARKTAFGYVENYLKERELTVTKAETERLISGLVGVKRSTGQHPGGLVIIPQDMDVTDFCPVQHPADSPEKGIITTHFDYHSMEDNLLKIDALGHDDPTMIKMLEDLTGVDAAKIPLDDEPTRGIFTSPKPLGLPEDDPTIGKTGTIGIPEFGTVFTRGMLADTRPDEFDTLVRLSGFSHGTDVWLGNAKDLIMSKTASIKETIGCRDDIMLYLISMGMEEKIAFKVMESVRKGRGLLPEWSDEMLQLGIPKWYIESCRKIKYLFPKAHAVAYVMMAFRIAWFKVHEPLAYYSAHFYRRADSFDAETMTRGISRVRAKLRELTATDKLTAKEQDTVTTLESVYEFYMRGFDFDSIDIYKSDATRFIISESGLLPPFTAITGLGEATARDIVAARDGRQLVSVEDLGKVSQTHIEQLRSLGALGDLPDTAQLSLF